VSNSPFLRVDGVVKRFAGRVAVDRVSLDINAGESIVVFGPSGCGKTTLLRLIAGLESPDEGDIWLDGQHVAGGGRNLMPPHARGLGMVFQDLALWPHLMVREHLHFVLRATHVPKNAWPERVRETLTLVRIETLADRYPHQLSGGEQQRAALARTLVVRPRALLLDEPFSSLDEDLRIWLRDELIRVQRSLQLTMLSVTHHRDDAYALADRIIRMRHGQIEPATPATEDSR
jgi:ABC-type Fe3+/spermidine/putrescine transport system ATPase subunit